MGYCPKTRIKEIKRTIRSLYRLRSKGMYIPNYLIQENRLRLQALKYVLSLKD